MSGFTYLATPYSHDDPAVREYRYQAACRAAGKLMSEGHVVFSPIAHSHPVEVLGIRKQMPGSFWKRQDIPVLRHAEKVVVLMLDGWDQSAGIQWEVETAEALHIPVEYMHATKEITNPPGIVVAEPEPIPAEPSGGIAVTVKQLIAGILGAPASAIHESLTLDDRLGLDSIDKLELMIDIEDEFDVEITDTEASAIKDVGDLITIIHKKKGAN